MNLNKETNQFLSMLEENKGIIYKVVNSYCKDEEDRKDLIQEIIIQLWQSFGKYDKQFKISTWMYRIALNISISFYRKRRRREEVSHPLSENILYIMENDEADELNYYNNLLQKFIAELKELDRALIILYLEEKSHKEISEILGITETNVATKISRIKIKLKKKFSNIK
jgi:RNA polymerase sigma-70 factor (ECF subfamily)